jgi:hypothetical protein
VPVLEPERRRNHIDTINHDNCLLPIAVDCLHFKENERPSSEELCQRLASLKKTREYRENVEQIERMQNNLERQVEEVQLREMATVHQLQNEIQQLHQRYLGEIQSKDGQIRTLNQRLNDHSGTIDKLRDEFQQECQKYQSEIQAKDRKIQKLQQQLKEQTQAIAEIQQTNDTLQNTTPSQPPPPVPLPRTRFRERRIQQDRTSIKKKPSQPSPQQVHHQKPHPPVRQVKIGEWRDGGRVPYNNMCRGAAVVDGNVAYFMSFDGRTYSYDSSTLTWSELPRYSYWHSSLAVIKGLLTAIGGSSEVTNLLLSMIDNEWVERFLRMPTKRSSTAVVSTREHLIVAGGNSVSFSKPLDTVEVMDVQTRVWSTAASLPHPYSHASATICGEQLYMLGGGSLKSVLTCSLTKLLQSRSKTSSIPVWHRIADVPVCSTTCAAVNGELVAVGGEDVKGKTTSSAIHKYNPTTDSWDIISNMPTARYHSLVAVLPTNEVMMVVGGNISMFSVTDKVEIFS